MKGLRHQATLYRIKAGFRDTWLLLRQFQWLLFILCVTVLGGGLLYYNLATLSGEPLVNFHLGIRVISATGKASPVFATAASVVDMTKSVTIEEQAFSLDSLEASKNIHLVGKTVREVESQFHVSVVLLRGDDNESDFHSAFDKIIRSKDTLAVFGGAEEISILIQNGCD